jgi:hypothetical protein
MAIAAAALGDWLWAACIWGVAARLREEIGSPLLAEDQREHDRSVAAARAGLGDDTAFDRARKEGRALTLEQSDRTCVEQRRAR